MRDNSVGMAKKGEEGIDIERYVAQLVAGEIDGHDLARMVHEGILSKSDRRKITKKQSKVKGEKPTELTERQKLRQEIKAKKSLPKLSTEERRKKYVGDIDATREKEREQFVVCLGCRKRGHSLKNCPNAAEKNICFNCNSTDHILRNCPEARDPTGYLPFATCFVCKKQGHLSKDCDENPNGLYPNGGCCSVCFQKTHLVRDCPERTEEEKAEYERKRKERREEKDDMVEGLVVEDVYEGGIDDDNFEIGLEEEDREGENKWDRKLRKKKERKDKRSRRF